MSLSVVVIVIIGIAADDDKSLKGWLAQEKGRREGRWRNILARNWREVMDEVQVLPVAAGRIEKKKKKKSRD